MKTLIDLPEPSTTGGPPLWQVLKARRSVRHYRPEPMPLDVLSQLLWSTHGITGEAPGRELRNAPSAGACYPIEALVTANRVAGLDPGLYRYVPRHHALAPVREGELGPKIADATYGQTMCATASVVFIWTAVVSRTTARYGDRGRRYVFLDAGHVGQNAYLAATALGYGCCTVGAFDDDAMNEIVGVDGTTETVVYAATVGPLE